MCCPLGSTINACGVCGGPVGAIVSATGKCCANGIVDAGGACCDSGAVDTFGVCDGNDASGKQVLGLTVNLDVAGAAGDSTTSPSSLATALSNPTSASYSRVAAAFQALVHTALGRPTSAVSVTSARVDLTGVASGAVTVPAALVVDLLPYGGPNALPSVTLLAALQGAGARRRELTGGMVAVASVDSADPAPVCGNGACEAGERPNPGAGVVGCATDCPVPIVTCPDVNGLVCGGVGACVANTAGEGECQCRTMQGYGGPACEECVAGFQRIGSTCARVETAPSATPSPTPTTSPSPVPEAEAPVDDDADKSHPVLIVGAAVGGGVVVVAVVVGLLIVKYKQPKAKGTERRSSKGSVAPLDEVAGSRPSAQDSADERAFAMAGGPRKGSTAGPVTAWSGSKSGLSKTAQAYTADDLVVAASAVVTPSRGDRVGAMAQAGGGVSPSWGATVKVSPSKGGKPTTSAPLPKLNTGAGRPAAARQSITAPGALSPVAMEHL